MEFCGVKTLPKEIPQIIVVIMSQNMPVRQTWYNGAYVHVYKTGKQYVHTPLGNEEASLSGIASITIDTASFYSHVRQLHSNDKFAWRRARTEHGANLVAIFRYTRPSILEMSFTTIERDKLGTNGLHITGLRHAGRNSSRERINASVKSVARVKYARRARAFPLEKKNM